MARKLALGLGVVVIMTALIWLVGGALSRQEDPLAVSAGSSALKSATIPKSTVPGPESGAAGPMDKRVSVARRRWDAIAADVRSLDSTDQADLEKLYHRAREAIAEDEAAWFELMSRSMSEMVGASFEESFFAVGAWIRFSQSPVRILEALWQYQPPLDSEQGDFHHRPLTQALRHERVEAFGLRELRQQLGQGGVVLSASDSRRLIAELLPRAARERSLDLSIEMIQLLAILRAPKDSIEAVLRAHQPRDRELLRGILNAQ